jgi:hypothetical protein
MKVLCFLLLPFLVRAQSDFQADTLVQEEFEPEEDSPYSAVDREPDTVIYRSTPDSVIAQLQSQKDFAYANDAAYWKKAPPRRSSWGLFILSAAFQYLLFGLFIVVLIYVLFRLLSENKIILFKRNKKLSTPSGEEETPEQLDLTSLIADAEMSKHFRLAARYRYLHLLEAMDARQLIRKHPELTNWDYVRQLGTHPLSPKFRYLTHAYEYVWYGEFELNSDQYAQLRKNFETFLQ